MRAEVGRLINLIGFKNGAINVEIRITKENKIYIMEVGPRSGGNYVPQLMKCATGFDEVAAIIDLAMGNKPVIRKKITNSDNYCLQYIIGATKTGKFSKIELSIFFKERVQKIYLHKKKGETINPYINSSNVVGVLIAKCTCAEELKNVIDGIHSHVRVIVE